MGLEQSCRWETATNKLARVGPVRKIQDDEESELSLNIPDATHVATNFASLRVCVCASGPFSTDLHQLLVHDALTPFFAHIS